MTEKKTYGVMIQTDVRSEYRWLQGWDTVWDTRADAEACARRAMKNDWHDAKVVELDA